jgi:hypothetical protein
MRAGLAWIVARPGAWWRSVWVLTLEIGGAVLIPVGVIALLNDLEGRREERDDREEDRINRAWSLVAAAKVEGTGNVGLIEALETLASRGINLSQAKLPGAYLYGARLSRARLLKADLSEAVLVRADPRGANLGEADLSEATLFKANLGGVVLRKANLARANLLGATLVEADLIRATLIGTNLAGADLSRAELVGAKLVGTDLSRAELERAQLCNTTMPDGGVCNRDCRAGRKGNDRSCPFLGGQTPEQQPPQGPPNAPPPRQMSGTRDPGR